MTDFMRRFGVARAFRRFGRFQEVPAVERQYARFSSFAGGLNMQDSREDVERDSSPSMTDIEVTKNDSLRRAPGLTTVETYAGRNPLPHLALHANLDNRAELVLFDPPFIGVKDVSGTVWTDVGLPTGRLFRWTVFGGTLIFSNGVSSVFSRQPYATTVDVIPEAPVARAYATFAGRVWAGGATIDGRYEPLGMAWSAANSDYTDWTSIGSGDELLISNVETGDRVVAIMPMGLDFMAIVCRRAIWIGRRTGLRDRPADFQPRVPGVGAINEPVCRVTPEGVALLSDDGVYLFDGNTEHHISKQIDPDLLPLDYTKLDDYSGFYNPFTKRYYLMTPTKTFVYDLKYKRWYRRSAIAQAAAVLAEQLSQLTWGQLTGSWGAQTATWSEFSPAEGDEYDLFFLGKEAGVSKLAVEDQAATAAFGLTLDPFWETHIQQSQLDSQLILLDDLLVTYYQSGTIQLALPNHQNDFAALASNIVLANKTRPDVHRVQPMVSSRGAGMRLRIVSGDPIVTRLALGATPRGARIG